MMRSKDHLFFVNLFTILLSVTIVGCSSQNGFKDNALTEQEQKEGWQLLFNGENLQGFHTIPGGNWQVKDGMIIGTSEQIDERHGLLVTDNTYGDFTVKVDYKALQGNSGLYFRVEEVEGNVGVHGFQAEIDADGNDVGGLYETGGRAWVVQTTPEEVKDYYKRDEWNHMTVSAHGGHILVTVNGQKSAEIENDPGRRKGHIALQLHGGQDMHVMYKNLKIKTE